MGLIRAIYFVILGLFLTGAVAFFFINRQKSAEQARTNRLKYITYFGIIHLIFFAIVIHTLVFRIISLIIILAGLTELIRLYGRTSHANLRFFAWSILIFGFLSVGFYLYGGMEKGVILFTFMTVSVFDSFSQISGQLWGRMRILPVISPHKTAEGLAGGAVAALVMAIVLKGLLKTDTTETFLTTIVIILFAFWGDVLASAYKRKFGVKDFSNLIPGHGGMLDRFDSLIAGGAAMFMAELIFK